MKFIYNIFTMLISILLLSSITSCEKMSDTYSEYVKGGEIVYTPKADSLKSNGGKNRIKLSWLSNKLSNATRAKIYWNNKADSIDRTVTFVSGVPRFELIIDNLLEGSYSFDVYTFDNNGNTSIKVTAAGNVYGDNYKNSLINRKILSTNYVGADLIINWVLAEPGLVDTQVTHTANDGSSQTVSVLAQDKITTLIDHKKNTEIKLESQYLPEEGAIDSFFSGETFFSK